MDEDTLRRIIREGRPEKGMPAWGERLSEAEIEALIRLLREWEIGCFVPGHYEAGMKGTLVIR